MTTLQQYPEKLAIVRLGPGAEIPSWAESSSIFSVTATAGETSLVCAGRSVPTKVPGHRGLIAFEVEAGGSLVELLAALADDDVRAFPLATFDAGWLLVGSDDVERAAEAWRRRGHTVEPAVPATGKHRS